MRGRIRKRLVEARQMLEQGEAPAEADAWFASLPAQYPEGDARAQALLNLELALHEIADAPIHTIHGFCQRTLSERAFSSNQPLEMEQMDEQELVERLMRDWWRRRTYGLGGAQAEALGEVTGGFEEFRNRLEPLIKNRSLQLVPGPEEREELEARLRALSRAWSDDEPEIREILLGKNRRLNGTTHRTGTLEKAMEAVNQSLASDPPRMPPADALAAILPDAFKLKGKPTEEEQAEFRKAYDAIPSIRLLRELSALGGADPELVAELEDARSFVLEGLAEAGLARGQLSFNDMIERLHQALEADSDRARRMARDLARRYPVILVDEFQDTDPLQYGIFSRIHRAAEPGGHTLVLIGDPKQAIYGFRGGDIFTYMQARGEADRWWKLSVNWRSTPGVIEAVNELFTGNRPFSLEEIPYHRSEAPPSERLKARTLTIDGEPAPAMVFEELPRKDNGKHIGSKKEAEEWVHASVAAQIAQLLALVAKNKAKIGDRPLEPADIAILVRSHAQASALRQALLEHGVRAVATERDSIWTSTEAEGLLRLLEGALSPEDRPLPRQALASDLLNLPYPDMHALMTDPHRWANWVELLAESGNRWRRQGFMAAFLFLLQGLSSALDTDGTDWLQRTPQPERTLTNLLHLAELLQAASRDHATPELLLQWMKRQIDDATTGEEYEPRLESDERLVKILTIHKSKGLQFPVVFVPYLWADATGKNRAISWHEPDEHGWRYLHCPGPCQRGRLAAAHERLAENLRLAYVALTRAESHCHVHFGPGGSNSGRSPLVWLFSEQDHDFTRAEFNPKPEHMPPPPFKRLAHVEFLEPYRPDVEGPSTSAQEAMPELETATFSRTHLRRNWRIGSFSAMTRGVHQATRAPAATGAERLALRYPAGAHVGNFLHALLERIEPDKALRPQIENMADWLFRAHGLPDDETHRDLDGLTDWIQDILHTPLDDSGLTLAALGPRQQKRELEFDLSAGTVDPDAVNALLAGSSEVPRTPLGFDRFQGMLTGAIDLVFEHEGRYFVADYKSNLLGRTLEDYAPPRLRREILDRHYDLQYLLYTLALHRHLRRRLPDYDYERDFGGVYYLFLRAMTPEHGPRYGVFFDRPEQALIERMDHDIIGVSESAA
ncbi:MAG: hypothetical protein D6717_02845 [Gammaproteobacteria bacterium]|nr:MAG: hypothetical protein D6717_02845 [Gammaproteobacteria bacterium]